MKTLIRMITVAAFIGLLFGFTTSNEMYNQSASDDNRSYAYMWETTYWAPVVCDGVEVDLLIGPLTAHFIDHYKNGEWAWSIIQMQGEITSDLTGEVFQVHEVDKMFLPPSGTWSFHWNLVGDMGSHYIASGSLDLVTWELTFDKTICHGD